MLDSLRSFEDDQLGIRERFLTPEIGGAATIAVLSEPLRAAPTSGWVIAPSFAFEQTNLMALEVSLARGLAKAGFATLRYHGQGYGDSLLGSDVIGVASHIRDAGSAVEVLRAAAGVHEVGILGVRFGAAIATLVAAGAGASRLVLIDPAIHGGTYIHALVRRAEVASYGNRDAISGWLALRDREGTDLGADPGGDSAETLDLGDVLVTPALMREMDQLDASQAASAFAGRSLVVQVSRRAEVRDGTHEIALALREADGRCQVQVVADETALRFGLPRWRMGEDGRREDGQARLSQAIVDQVVAWATAPG